MKKAALAAALVLAISPMAALADDLSDARDAYMAAWEAAPLNVRKSLFVVAPVESGGIIYQERENNVFAADEPIHIYLEPEAYGWVPTGDEFEFGQTVGLKLLTEAGDVLFEKADYWVLKMSSTNKLTEFSGSLTMNQSDTPAGMFVMELLLTDIASGKTATVTMPFEIQ